MVGKKELFAFVERHAGQRMSSFGDLATGEVLCRLISHVFPRKSIRPAARATHSASQQAAQNWPAIAHVCDELGIPRVLVDRKQIERGVPRSCASVLVMLYFLYNLVKSPEFAAEFSVDVSEELTDFLQSMASVRALVRGGAMRVTDVPPHLQAALADDAPQLDVPAAALDASLPRSGSEPKSAPKARVVSPARDSPPPQDEQADGLVQELMAELEEMHGELDNQVAQKAELRGQLMQAHAHVDELSKRVQQLEGELEDSRRVASAQLVTGASMSPPPRVPMQHGSRDQHTSAPREQSRSQLSSLVFVDSPRGGSSPHPVTRLASPRSAPSTTAHHEEEHLQIDFDGSVGRMQHVLRTLCSVVDTALGDSAAAAGHASLIQALQEDLWMLVQSHSNLEAECASYARMPREDSTHDRLRSDAAMARCAAEQMRATSTAAEEACKQRLKLAESEVERLRTERQALLRRHQDDIFALEADAERRVSALRARLVPLAKQMEALQDAEHWLRRGVAQLDSQPGFADARRAMHATLSALEAQVSGDADVDDSSGDLSSAYREIMQRCISDRDAATEALIAARGDAAQASAQLRSCTVAMEAERELRRKCESELQTALRSTASLCRKSVAVSDGSSCRAYD